MNENLTKNQMARVIIQALFNMDEPPSPDHFRVKRAERRKKDDLARYYKHACKKLNAHGNRDRVRNERYRIEQ